MRHNLYFRSHLLIAGIFVLLICGFYLLSPFLFEDSFQNDNSSLRNSEQDQTSSPGDEKQLGLQEDTPLQSDEKSESAHEQKFPQVKDAEQPLTTVTERKQFGHGVREEKSEPHDRDAGPILYGSVKSAAPPGQAIRASLEVYSAGANTGRRLLVARQTTDLNGKYMLALPPGSYVLAISAEGYQKVESSILLKDEDMQLNITLIRADGSIEGRVLDENGNPVSGARIGYGLIGEVHEGKTYSPVIDEGKIVRSDEAGKYKLEGLPPGGINIFSLKEGYQPYAKGPITLKAGEKLSNFDLVLEKGISISGQIVDEDRRPVASAVITDGISPLASSDGAGRFALSMSKDTPHVTVRAHGFPEKRVSTKELMNSNTIILAKGVRVSGVVKNRANEPIGDCDLLLINRRTKTSTRFETNSSGYYEIFIDKDDLYELIVTHPDYLSEVVEISSKHQFRSEIILTKAAKVAGRVFDSDTGTPIQNFTVSWTPLVLPSDPQQEKTRTASRKFADQIGHFSLKLAPGIYQVRFSASGYNDFVLEHLSVIGGDGIRQISVPLVRSTKHPHEDR